MKQMALGALDLDDDSITLRELGDDTFADAESLVLERFPEKAVAQLRKVMTNPARRDSQDSGMIAYENGKPICFQAAIPRIAFCKQQRVVCATGGMTCTQKDATPVAVWKVVSAAHQKSKQQVLSFGNTLCRATIRLNKMLGVTDKGPDSMSGSCFCVLRPIRFLVYCFWRKLLKKAVPWRINENLPCRPFSMRMRSGLIERDSGFKGKGYDDFWARYVKTNQGFACSRTEDELEWAFGERVVKGSCVILALRKEGQVLGYVVLESWGAGIGIARWRILDLIAIDNDCRLLDELLSGAKKFLLRHTPAMSLETMGFPAWFQPVLRRHLRHFRALENNFFLFMTRDTNLKSLLQSDKSWFFGPYDGDMCM